MNISLIGMSNIGKSQFAQRLERELGYRRVECDQLIEAELREDLSKGGFSGLQDLSRWMGQPYEDRYHDTSSRYLAAEQEVLIRSLRQLTPASEPTVIDTTGSVIYLPEELLQELRTKTTVVYLKADDDSLERLFQSYLREPKPVIWGEEFNPLPGETAQSALARCYPQLVAFRAAKYALLADVELDFHVHRNPDRPLSHLLPQLAAAGKRS